MADMDKLVVRDLRDQSTSEYDIKDSAARDELSNVKADLSEATRNIFNISAIPKGSNLTYADDVVVGSAGAFNSAYGANTQGIMPNYLFEENTQYTLSFETKNDDGGTGNGLAFILTYSDGTVGYVV